MSDNPTSTNDTLHVSIGILSDSHGQADRTARAMEILHASGSSLFVHLGDIETESVIDALLLPGSPPVHLVFGNVDWPAIEMARYAGALGLQVHDSCGSLTVDDRRIVFHHGHEPRYLMQSQRDGTDYFLHGHTHARRDEMLGDLRVINPGALHRARPHTVAQLTPATGELTFIDVS